MAELYHSLRLWITTEKAAPQTEGGQSLLVATFNAIEARLAGFALL